MCKPYLSRERENIKSGFWEGHADFAHGKHTLVLAQQPPEPGSDTGSGRRLDRKQEVTRLTSENPLVLDVVGLPAALRTLL